MVLKSVTVAAALCVGAFASMNPAIATERASTIAVTASSTIEISESDLLNLKEKIQSELANTGSSRLTINIDSIAIRPGGTPATLRQLGGHDAIRLTISSGAKEESVLVTSRTEGLTDQSLRSRRGKLFAAAATVLKNRMS
jgi:hypothetical protein